jgi:PKD repeat protein
MRSIKYLPVAILLLVSGMLWGQTVHLEVGGVPTTIVCEVALDYRFIGTNPDGAIGTFELFQSTGTPVPGHITDLGNNTATLDPAGLDGNYYVEYSYVVDEVTYSVRGDFTVTLLDNIQIQDLPETVCKNDPPYRLIPVPSLTDPGATYTFSGPGVSGNQSSGYYYNPASSQVAEGWIQISLYYTSSLGCQVLNSISIFNSFVPSPNFTATSSCIPSTGGLIQFDNLTSGQYAVETWSWNFGDPDSGPDNTSNESDPAHEYPSPGNYSVSLTAQTYDGCISSRVQNMSFADQPLVDFTWITDCFTRGENTSFLSRSVSPYATINSLVWTFRTTGGGVLGQISSTNPEDTIDFPFTSLADYRVTLDVENNLACSGSITKTISLKPVVTLTTEGYLETFDIQSGDWFVDSENDIESWLLGEPDFTGFTPETGNLAWYTHLPTTGGYLENSWVESPCFDLSALSTPLVQLDIMKSFVPGTDGVVLQYEHRVSEGWNTLGVVDGGISWYNSYGIFNRPGGSTFGWSLNTFEPDEAWVRASYALGALSDFSNVKFRVIIGTEENSIGNQGFAFDDFYLGEGVKNSILEYFTNSASTESLEADAIMEQFVEDNASLVIDLQYHMDYPGEDPMNQNNPVPPSVRAFNYGIPVVPYGVLDGGSAPEFRYDFSDESEQPNEEALKSSALVISPFDLSLNTNFLSNRLEGKVVVHCKEDDFESNIQLYVVVIEELVTAYTGENGGTEFRNVVLDILPTASGKLLGNEWGVDVSTSLDFNWNYAPYVEDVEDLTVVAFILDRDRDQILQSEVVEYSPGTGFDKQPAGENLAIYPNPSNAYVYVNFGTELTEAGSLRFVDLAGRTVHSEEVYPGYSIQRLDISKLSPGVYMVQWEESGLIRGHGKLVRGQN